MPSYVFRRGRFVQTPGCSCGSPWQWAMRFRIVFVVRMHGSSFGLSYCHIPTKTNNAEQGTFRFRAHLWAHFRAWKVGHRLYIRHTRYEIRGVESRTRTIPHTTCTTYHIPQHHLPAYYKSQSFLFWLRPGDGPGYARSSQKRN